MEEVSGWPLSAGNLTIQHSKIPTFPSLIFRAPQSPKQLLKFSFASFKD
jgi:hypothetical protein